MSKIKKGDKIKVLLGKDRGKEGQVEKVFGKEGKVLILGVNVYKRHVKKQGIIEIPKPIDISNVALICPLCKKPTRISFKEIKDNKLRVCKKCKKEINE